MDDFTREMLYCLGRDDYDQWSIEELDGGGAVVRHKSGQQATVTKFKEYRSNLTHALFCAAASAHADPGRTDIDELIKEYENEDCDFTNLTFLIRVLDRHVKVMPDSVARAALAEMLRLYVKPKPVQQEVLHEFPYTDEVIKAIRDNVKNIVTTIQNKVGGYVDVPIAQVVKRRYNTKKGKHSRVYLTVWSDAVDHVLVKVALSEALSELDLGDHKPIKLCFTSVNAFPGAAARTFQFRAILEHDADYGDYLV